MITIKISGPAGAGKTRAAAAIKTLLEADSYGQVLVIDEVSSSKLNLLEGIIDIDTMIKANVLILVGENL